MIVATVTNAGSVVHCVGKRKVHMAGKNGSVMPLCVKKDVWHGGIVAFDWSGVTCKKCKRHKGKEKETKDFS